MMKKYFYLAIAAIVSVAFVSCGNDEPGKKEDKKAVHTITVGEVTATTADITVTPKDAAAPYFWNIFEKEAIDAEFGTNYDSVAYDLCEYYEEQYEELVENYGSQLAQQGITDLASLLELNGLLVTGEDNYLYEGLDPETTYLVVAFSFNSTTNRPSSAVATAEFTTGKLEKINFSIAVSENDTAVFVAPSNENQSYLITFIEKDSLGYYGYTNETYFEAYVDYVAEMAETYAAYGVDFSYFLNKGQVYVPKSELEVGMTYNFIAAAFVGATQCSDICVKEYTYTPGVAAVAPVFNAPARKIECKNMKVAEPTKELRLVRRPVSFK